MPASDDLEYPRGAHPSTDAHGRHHELHAATLALDQSVAGEPRARNAVGVTDRDRAAIHVEAFVGDAELVAAVDHLHRERLVELPEPDVVDFLAGALEQSRHGEDGADAHFIRLATGHREAPEDSQGLQALLGSD